MPLIGLRPLGVLSVRICIYVSGGLVCICVFVCVSVSGCIVFIFVSGCLVLSGPDAPLWAVTEWIEATVRLPA